MRGYATTVGSDKADRRWGFKGKKIQTRKVDLSGDWMIWLVKGVLPVKPFKRELTALVEHFRLKENDMGT